MSSKPRLKFDAKLGPFKPGDKFQKFEIKKLLGRGGHAFVYHGYDTFLDRNIALKVISDPAERGKDLQRRAQLEARVLCKLQHPNVVHVYDAGTIGDELVYIIMELLEGRTLRHVLRELGQLTVPEMLLLGAQIADGVQAAHEESAVHRDLKPENVFVLPENRVKVLDFGIAKFLGMGAQTTQKDLLHGTMLYMSPEHLQSLGVTVRSDIYALGTILYEAMAGKPPCMLGVQVPTVRELAWIQISKMPPPLDQQVPGVPRHVARTVQRMLAKDPADRFASMAEVAEALRANFKRYSSEAPHGTALPRELWLGPSLTPAPRGVLPSHTVPLFGLNDEQTARSPMPAFTGEHEGPTPLPAPGFTGDHAPFHPTRTEELPPGASFEPPPGFEIRAPAQHAASIEQAPTTTHASKPADIVSAPKSPRASHVVAAAVAVGTVAGAAIGFAAIFMADDGEAIEEPAPAALISSATQAAALPQPPPAGPTAIVSAPIPTTTATNATTTPSAVAPLAAVNTSAPRTGAPAAATTTAQRRERAAPPKSPPSFNELPGSGLASEPEPRTRKSGGTAAGQP